MTDTRPTLTKPQLDTLEALHRFHAAEGYMPTVRELAEALGLKSHSTAAQHVRGLVDKGYLERRGARALRFVYPS